MEPSDADTAREACGVVGVYHPGQDVARVAFFGIYALQHRGQESAGIASADGSRVHNRTSMGLIGQSFAEDDLVDLPGHISIAHTRYSTTGSNRIVNAQPVMARGPESGACSRPQRQRHQRHGAPPGPGGAGVPFRRHQRHRDHRQPARERARPGLGGPHLLPDAQA